MRRSLRSRHGAGHGEESVTEEQPNSEVTARRVGRSAMPGARHRDGSGTQAAGPGMAWRVLRQRDFGLYFVGNASSASGTWFQNLAASILVYRLTHSAFLLGVLNFAQFIPVLVLSPWAGAVADRVDRRILALVTQAVAAALAAALAVLAWTGSVDEWTVIAFGLAAGVTSAFSAPAQMALVASLVDEDDLPQAV